MPFRRVPDWTTLDESGRFFDFFAGGGGSSRDPDPSPGQTEGPRFSRGIGHVGEENHHDNIVRQFYGLVKVTTRSDKEG